MTDHKTLIQSEQSVIGSLLRDNDSFDDIESLKSNDFFREDHRVIFSAIQLFLEKGKPVDLILLAEFLETKSKLGDVGGLARISDIVSSVNTSKNIKYHASRVVQESKRRRLKALLEDLSSATESKESIEEITEKAESGLFELLENNEASNIAHIGDAVAEAIDWIDSDEVGLKTGLLDLDRMVGGFNKSNLIIIAGRPSMGKSALAFQIAEQVAKHNSVVTFSLEMSRREIGARLLKYHESKVGRSEAVKHLYSLKMHIDDKPGVTISHIRSVCRKIKRKQGLDMIVIDYIQLMTGRGDNRTQEIGAISRGLKGLAKEFDIPVVALSQLSRKVEDRADKRPLMSDLRDCLPATALITNADTGERVAIGEIYGNKLEFNVWAMDENYKLVSSRITHSWATGKKEIFIIKTKTGRVLKCSGGHRVFGSNGWIKASELIAGNDIALPRLIPNPLTESNSITTDKALLLGWLLGDGHFGGTPCITVSNEIDANIAIDYARKAFPGINPYYKQESKPDTPAKRVVLTTGNLCGAGKNPLTTWLREMGIWGSRSCNKYIPEIVFKENKETICALLRGLFHADGSMKITKSTTRTISLSSISEQLIYDVQTLLLRLGILSTVAKYKMEKSGYRTNTSSIFDLRISDKSAVENFVINIGFLSDKQEKAMASINHEKKNDASQIDRMPLFVSERVRNKKNQLNLSHADLGWRDQGKKMSRNTCLMLAAKLQDTELERLGKSDLLWDQVVGVEKQDAQETYEITVADNHNFCVDNFIAHNSGEIEQDADVILFIFREEVHNDNSNFKGHAEIICRKNRNGAIGDITTTFSGELTRFGNYSGERILRSVPTKIKGFSV